MAASLGSMSEMNDSEGEWSGFREKCRRIIFLHNKPAEKLFDILLIAAIAVSLVVVMLDSVESIRARYGAWLVGIEWGLTILFTIEYIVRLYVAKNALRYGRSFFGIVDLLSILPTYLDLLVPGAHYLMTFRVLRMLRIFRVLKMVQYIGEANILARAVRASARKISVFVFAVVTLACILGSMMYLIEGPENGYTSIPRSVYWAIVTLTTVGYGDISPQTTIGQFFASVIMLTGYGIIAVPTGIVTAEITRVSRAIDREYQCHSCGQDTHQSDARFCRSCGHELKSGPSE